MKIAYGIFLIIGGVTLALIGLWYVLQSKKTTTDDTYKGEWSKEKVEVELYIKAFDKFIEAQKANDTTKMEVALNEMKAHTLK